MTHYLLTGATGVVGSAVLQRLLAWGRPVFLPVRAADSRELSRRARDLLRFIGSDWPARIIPVRADLLRPGLGMDPRDYRMLARDTTHIIHCAGDVRMNLPRQTAVDQTLAVTRHMVALMEDSRKIKKMEFVSTVGVAGTRPGEIPENWFPRPASFRTPYEEAKFHAEAVIRKKIDQGLNITVHRPSMVVGDSRTGRVIRFQVFYYLCEFLSGARTHGWIPDLSGHRLDTVPSDYAADLICWASTREKGLPPVLHACSGPARSLELNRLGRIVRRCFRDHGRILPRSRKLPITAFSLLSRVLARLAPEEAGRRLATLPLFLSYLDRPQCFGNTETRKLAEASGVFLPDPDTYVRQVLSAYLAGKKD